MDLFDSIISSYWTLPCCLGCLDQKDYQCNGQLVYTYARMSRLACSTDALKRLCRRLKLIALALEAIAPARAVRNSCVADALQP